MFSLRGAEYKASQIAERLRDHAWYIAMAPIDKPTIAVVALVENGGFGAEAAAPIVRKVMDAFFNPTLLDAAIKRDVPASEAINIAAAQREVKRAR